MLQTKLSSKTMVHQRGDNSTATYDIKLLQKIENFSNILLRFVADCD